MRADDLRDALHRVAETTPAPDHVAARRGVDRRVRRHRSRRLLAIAALAVIVLGLGLLFAQTRGDDRARVVTGVDQVPRLVPSFVPDQVTLGRVIDLPYQPKDSDEAQATQPSYVTIFSTGSGADDLAGSTFGVALTRLWPTSPETTAFGDGRVEVRSAPGGFRRAAMVIAPGVLVAVLSRQMSDDELSTVLRSVTVGSDGTTIESIDVPDGYHAVVTDHQTGVFGHSGTLANTAASGYVAAFASPGSTDSQSRYVLLAVTQDDQDGLDVLRWSLTDPTEVEIDGHRALLGSFDGGESMSSSPDGSDTVTPGPRTWVLAWRLDDRTLVTIEVIGGLPDEGCSGDCTPAVIQRFAQSLRTVTGPQWDAFVSATTTTVSDPDCSSVQLGDGQECTSSDTAVAVEPASTPSTTGG